jgi:Copine/C2 domain
MKLELSIHASKLKNVAGTLKGTSDPFAVVTVLATTPGTKASVVGKTETIKNTLSPSWVKVFVFDYELGTPLKVAINVFDEEKNGKHKPMGSAVFEVGEILAARGSTKAKKLPKNQGTVFVNVRKQQGSGTLRLGLKGSKLKNTEGMFSKSDPFFELSRRIDSAGGLTWDNVHRSEFIKNSLDPVWSDAVVDLSVLNGGDLELPIKISVFDFEGDGKHVNMGSCETSVKAMQQAATSGSTLTLMNKGKSVGTLQVTKAVVEGVMNNSVDQTTQRLATASISAPSRAPPAAPGQHAFADYIAGGCQLNVVTAIDFTGSNGDPRQPGTLHFLHPGQPAVRNQYESAISAICGTLASYDHDQMFPVLGFGAKYGNEVKHCFQVGNSAEVKGVAGILDAYHNVFKSGLIMSGPTLFDQIIDYAANRATTAQQVASSRNQQAYTVLLILTDGAVTDVAATQAALDRASRAPLSVVIVGVGNADFSGMRFLDDSNATSRGFRDIAQFVPFNEHAKNSVSLTSETLREIPSQLERYFSLMNVAPRPAIKRSDSEIAVESEDEIDLTLNIGADDEIVIAAGGDDFVDGFNASH